MKTIYQIQAFSVYWDKWDAEYVSQDTDATDFGTLAEAEAAVEELIEHGRIDRDRLRIKEVTA